jgi:hypothetical protein
LKKHKPWFDEGCSKLLYERKQAKLQWLQDLNEINGDNLNSVGLEASRHFRDKKREYLKDKINELWSEMENAFDSKGLAQTKRIFIVSMNGEGTKYSSKRPYCEIIDVVHQNVSVGYSENAKLLFSQCRILSLRYSDI